LITISGDSDRTEKELLSLKGLIHPTRLSIMLILERNFRAPAAELRKILGIPWGTFESHVKVLIKNKYITSRHEFYRNTPRVILYIESNGSRDLRKFIELVNEKIK
jgi:DNA-binding transcriptional ArsR family regulator